MGLKLHIECYDSETKDLKYEEYSKDFNDDGTVIESLGLPLKDNINNGVFNIEREWVPLLQPHFKNTIEVGRFIYQIGFIYRDGNW